jgi:hypothetical protein
MSINYQDLLLYYTTTLLLYYTTTLLHYYTTTLLHYYTTTLLLYYSTTLLLYYSTTLLLYYSTTLLLYYSRILNTTHCRPTAHLLLRAPLRVEAEVVHFSLFLSLRPESECVSECVSEWGSWSPHTKRKMFTATCSSRTRSTKLSGVIWSEGVMERRSDGLE